MSSLAKRATNRIMRDINYMMEEEVHKDGIYFWSNEDNVFQMKAMIVGPSGTPYEGGFYFFDITFPQNYPMVCPKVIHQTRTGRVRFNPNLYASGKVCLSILGTWSGPSWTPTMNVLSVLHSIQGMVLNECPLKNEPGFENRKKPIYDAYNGVIHYWNYRFAILQMAKNPVKGFEMFKPQVIGYLLSNEDKYDQYGAGLAKKYKKIKKVSCSYQNQVADKINYPALIKDLKKVRAKYRKEFPELVSQESPCIATPDSDSSSDYESDSGFGSSSSSSSSSSNKKDNYDNMKKAQLWTLCEAKGIDIRKPSKKTGNPILKTKAELILNLRTKKKS